MVLEVVSDGPEGTVRQNYQQVVNADGRLAIDATIDQRPSRPWLHRLKYGIRMQCPGQRQHLPAVTMMLGPFGDLVAYRSGEIYLSWDPICTRGLSQSLVPPDWSAEPSEPLRGW